MGTAGCGNGTPGKGIAATGGNGIGRGGGTGCANPGGGVAAWLDEALEATGCPIGPIGRANDGVEGTFTVFAGHCSHSQLASECPDCDTGCQLCSDPA